MLRERTRKPLFLMKRGIDTELFCPARRTVNDGVLRLGYVGRITPEKNVRFLRDLEIALRAAGVPPFRFLIVGDGSERAWLEQNPEAADLPGRRFHRAHHAASARSRSPAEDGIGRPESGGRRVMGRGFRSGLRGLSGRYSSEAPARVSRGRARCVSAIADDIWFARACLAECAAVFAVFRPSAVAGWMCTHFFALVCHKSLHRQQRVCCQSHGCNGLPLQRFTAHAPGAVINS